MRGLRIATVTVKGDASCLERESKGCKFGSAAGVSCPLSLSPASSARPEFGALAGRGSLRAVLTAMEGYLTALVDPDPQNPGSSAE